MSESAGRDHAQHGRDHLRVVRVSRARSCATREGPPPCGPSQHRPFAGKVKPPAEDETELVPPESRLAEILTFPLSDLPTFKLERSDTPVEDETELVPPESRLAEILTFPLSDLVTFKLERSDTPSLTETTRPSHWWARNMSCHGTVDSARSSRRMVLASQSCAAKDAEPVSLVAMKDPMLL